jgi:periplasmic copper chaperone A
MKILFPALLALALAGPALAQQTPAASAAQSIASQPAIEGAWVRATVAGQKATGAFMRITAKEAMQVVGVSSPAAGVAELHEMKMEGDTMRMRAIDTLELPAGKAVELKPGGYHLMLQDLKKPLEAGSTVPVTLVLRNAKGEQSRVQLELPVQAAAGMPMHKKH